MRKAFNLTIHNLLKNIIQIVKNFSFNKLELFVKFVFGKRKQKLYDYRLK